MPNASDDAKPFACSDCNRQSRGRNYGGPRKPRCRSCARAKKVAANERKRNADVERKYGLSAIEYAELFAFQNGRCALCNRPQVHKRLSVDHDHFTGLPRGLTCRNCNYVVIGMCAKDNPRYGLTLYDYLTDPPYRRMKRER